MKRNKTDRAVEEFRRFILGLSRVPDKANASEYLDDVLRLVRQHEHRKTLRTESLRYMAVIRLVRKGAIETGKLIERQKAQS